MELLDLFLWQDFIKKSLSDIKTALEGWLEEPQGYSAQVYKKFDFLIDGRSRKEIETFIKKKPKVCIFSTLCKSKNIFMNINNKTKEVLFCTFTTWQYTFMKN